MSQVQIRQIPLKTSTNNQSYVGAWFPTGFYGHFRAKPRPDLCQTFREFARPTPPRKFLERHNSEATKHLFSHHDNRLRFEADPLVRGTQKGFGRKKTDKHGRGGFDPLFIGWMPKNVDQEKSSNDIKISSYAQDFSRDLTSSQMINCSSNTVFPDISVYSSIYKHGQPDCEEAKKIRQETFERYLGTQTRRLQIKRLEPNATVASCLVWNNINDENKKTETIIDTILPLQSTNQQKPLQSQSLQIFNPTEINFPKRYGTALSQVYVQEKIIPPRSAVTTIDETNRNDINQLISKYM